MSSRAPFSQKLPPSAAGALKIVRVLRNAGHQAFLAGGCVRDLLLGNEPHDFDVATDAGPPRVCALFHATRKVGAQFGVVLVAIHGRWIEVATFRADGPYLDGRHPAHVAFSDARQDALRRDFTINGMFLDPEAGELIDYVGGRGDLQERRVRAIGDPLARFREDHLRLLRAVRFAARLEFAIESETLAAIRSTAAALSDVAPERVRDELEKMLGGPRPALAVVLLGDCRLLPHLWSGAHWSADHVEYAVRLLRAVEHRPSFELGLAILLSDRAPDDVHKIARELTCSNGQRETIAWLVMHHVDLDSPAAVSLADLKRLLAHPAFDLLRVWSEARHAQLGDGPARTALLASRVSSISPDAIAPAPLVTGEDLAQRAIPPGPVYKRVLDELYRRQLNDELTNRGDALRTLDQLLASGC